MALVVLSILLLISTYIYNGTSPHFMKKPILIVEVNLISFILLAGGLVFQREIPALVYTDGSPSASFLYLVVTSSIIIAYSAYLYLKRFREKPQILIYVLYTVLSSLFSAIFHIYIQTMPGTFLKPQVFTLYILRCTGHPLNCPMKP